MVRSARRRGATAWQQPLPFESENPTEGLDGHQLRALTMAVADLLVEALQNSVEAGEDGDDE